MSSWERLWCCKTWACLWLRACPPEGFGGSLGRFWPNARSSLQTLKGAHDTHLSKHDLCVLGTWNCLKDSTFSSLANLENERKGDTFEFLQV